VPVTRSPSADIRPSRTAATLWLRSFRYRLGAHRTVHRPHPRARGWPRPPQRWREYLDATFACASHPARGGICRTTSWAATKPLLPVLGAFWSSAKPPF